jgi:acetamidase/formamidase
MFRDVCIHATELKATGVLRVTLKKKVKVHGIVDTLNSIRS